MDLKYKSLFAHWFGTKRIKGGKDDSADAVDDNTKYIQRDTIITLSVARRKTTTLEHYCVLKIFSKHHSNGLCIGIRIVWCIKRGQRSLRSWEGWL